jgi:phage baseplate assembly protein W
MQYEISVDNAPIIIGASGLDDICQCLRCIARTVIFSVPLDRGFANSGSFVDSPAPHATAARVAELTEAIEKYEPRVKVSSIRFQTGAGSAEAAAEGRLTPVICFRIKEGA